MYLSLLRLEEVVLFIYLTSCVRQIDCAMPQTLAWTATCFAVVVMSLKLLG